MTVWRAGLSILVAGLAIAIAVAGGARSDVIGFARVLDGDSLVVGGIRIELYGIDAPERGQTCRRDFRRWSCGDIAARRLKELVSGSRLRCRAVARDVNRRTVALCFAGGMDLSETMVKCGLALAAPRAETIYLETEALARRLGQGIWAGEVVELWITRRIARRVPQRVGGQP